LNRGNNRLTSVTADTSPAMRMALQVLFSAETAARLTGFHPVPDEQRQTASG
jgi:hypothetical protein